MFILFILSWLRCFNPRMTLFTLSITVNDDDFHAIRIRIKFWIDSYAFHVYLAIFLTFDPKMTLFDPLDDLGWPRDTHQWIQKKICNRSICISCAFDHISDFWPQNDLFWPLRWPRMTSRCTPLNSEENFQSIDMHIVHIRYEINIISILTTRMSLNRALSLLSRPVALQKWDRRILRKICNQNLFFGVLHKPPSTGATRILEILELEKKFWPIQNNL